MIYELMTDVIGVTDFLFLDFCSDFFQILFLDFKDII